MASVWYQQVEEALMDLVKKTIIINNVGVKTIIRSPEPEFAIEEFPSVSISNIGTYFDKSRFEDYWARGEKHLSENKLEILPPAFPYNLDYQIDLWSHYHSQINDMSRMWLGNVSPHHVLTVVESTEVIDGETVQNLRDCTMFAIGVQEADIVTNNKRIFHRIYQYRIWVELDERLPILKPMVTVAPEITQKEN